MLDLVRYGLVRLYKLFIFYYPKVKPFTQIFFPDCRIWPVFAYNDEHSLKPSQMCGVHSV